MTWKIAWCHDGVLGGAKRAAHEMVRELVRRGHQVDEFVTGGVTDYLALEGLVRQSERLDWPHLPRLRMRPYLLEASARLAQDVYRRAGVRRTFRTLAERINQGGYDLVHLDHFSDCITTGLLPHLRVPTVVYSHEASGARYGTTHAPRTSAPLRAQRPSSYARLCQGALDARQQLRAVEERQQLRHAALVLTNSYFSSELFYHVYGYQAQVCYYGVNTEQFRPLGLPVYSMVLSAGRLAWAKQHHLAIEAAGLIDASRRPRVVIASPGRTPGSGAVERFLTQLADERGVELAIQHPSQHELVRLYNQALAVIFVPVMEPFGFIATEAMACGTPVIGVREGGIRESVIDGQTGLLVTRDPEAIAEAIQRLQQQPTLRRAIGERARRVAQTQWTWPRMIDQYEEAVGQMIGCGTAPTQVNGHPDRTKPTVSVIITTYNRAHFVTEAIASVQAQTYADWELVVVNDGSTDDTQVRVRKIAQRDPRIRLITKANGGIPAGRNTGIRAARGRFIALLDDDDLWYPQKLQRQMEQFRQNPSLGVSYTKYDEVDIVTGERTLLPTRPVRTLVELYRTGNILPSTAVVARRCFDVAGLFDPNRTRFDDKEMWLRIARHFPLACVNEALVERRMGAHSFERRPHYKIESFQDLRAVYEGFMPQPGDGISHAQRRRQIAKYSYLLGRAHQRAGQFQEAAGELMRALRANPLVGFHTRHVVRERPAWPRAAMDPWVRLGRCLYEIHLSRNGNGDGRP